MKVLCSCPFNFKNLIKTNKTINSLGPTEIGSKEKETYPKVIKF